MEMQKSAASSARTPLEVRLDFKFFSAAFDIQDGLDGASLDFMLHPYRFDLTADVGFALALNATLRLRPGGVVVLGLCCESFSIMCLDSC